MEIIMGDRRTDRRYDMRLQVRYRLLRGNRVLYEGTGVTSNLSRGGVAFRTERFVPSGLSIQLSIDWPLLLRGAERITLRLSGRTLRCNGDEVAVRSNWHEFVQGHSSESSAVAAQSQPALVM